MVEWTGEFAYQQVANDLRRRIAAGDFSEDGQLPSLGKLQQSYGVTPTVARAAVNRLKSEGLVVSHQGKGVFLTPSADKQAAQPGGLAQTVVELLDLLKKLREEVNILGQRIDAWEKDKNAAL